jgi:L-fuculose-phosphate aldolase
LSSDFQALRGSRRAGRDCERAGRFVGLPRGRICTREAVAAAARSLAAAGLVRRTSGNVSARLGDAFAVTPTGAELATVRADQIVIVDAGGGVIEGDGAPTSEIGLHLGIYEAYGAGAVVHTHAPAATAVGCVVEELPAIHYEMLGLGGAVRVAPYATFGTPELAAAAVAALDGRTAALLANHGTVAFGADLDGAMRGTELLEWAADLYLRASVLGTPKVLDQRALDAVIEAVAARGYGAAPAAGEREDA